ncbi:hypothetical protein AB205_0192880 [Aquarana catesbeiana]|uniref:Reverse transcriptase domain-containing protein n=1 Tax=Aquarana catesbeiana TaxID=8400 RepID=A0A2G9RKP0_AQUCT|nr:hypothetical protein AB205_0192880 [Aquarana catesbeiana]
MAIETLAIAIRSNPNVHGVTCGTQVHKCGLFADDMLLFITSLPNLCKLLKELSALSGLQVNYTKSSVLNVSLKTETVSLQSAFDFKWSDSSIDYLGIKLTAKTEQLYSANFPPTYRKLEADLGNWTKGEVPWLGRIHAIKMTLLPRLLYLFRALPINLKKDHLTVF